MVREGIFYRIVALRDFGNVKAGDRGGLIEKESNLSHDGNCWIYRNAEVYGNARVFVDAKVFDNAWVYGHALIGGDSKVCGNNYVCD